MGEHKTILTGTNATENWVQGGRLSIDLSKRRDIKGPHKVVVDGVIVDHGPRNRYNDETETKIIRMANPKTGQNPTPGFGGISVAVTKLGDIEIRNCVVINTAPTGGGAIAAWGSEKSNVVVENNLACNNTGYGFFLHSAFHPNELERMPSFTFRNNTSVFNSQPTRARRTAARPCAWTRPPASTPSTTSSPSTTTTAWTTPRSARS